MEFYGVKRLKKLEKESSRLKQMHAELSLDHNLLQGVIDKNCKVGRSASCWTTTSAILTSALVDPTGSLASVGMTGYFPGLIGYGVAGRFSRLINMLRSSSL